MCKNARLWRVSANLLITEKKNTRVNLVQFCFNYLAFFLADASSKVNRASKSLTLLNISEDHLKYLDMYITQYQISIISEGSQMIAGYCSLSL